jgi:hypothetical protein
MKVEVIGIFVMLCVLILMVLFTDTSTQCRTDALNAMCQVYGYSTGGAIKVIPGNESFIVVCDNRIGRSANMSGLLNVTR